MSKDFLLYNNLTQSKEKFIPLDEKSIRMYVCGPTVYDDPHIGNARPLVIFDLLFRALRFLYGNKKVNYVRNITDVDDKIIESSQKKKISISDLTKKILKNFHEDCDYLGCLKPTHEPKATEHIKEMIEMTKILLDKKFAYEKNSNIYFDVSKYSNYGQLSKKNISELEAGARVEKSKNKKNQSDFVLWKPSKDNEPAWESPWGKGRPGWHLECSCMSKKYLGKEFDIHGGGIDLIFPHHENEIAQSVCANGTKYFAKYWVHNGFITMNSEKMAKSVGNIITIKNLRNSINGQIVRLALMSAHYKQPLDWNDKLINESKNTLDKWYEEYLNQKNNEDIDEKILLPLLNDLNTPAYIASLHVLYEKSKNGNNEDKKRFNQACNFIGLLTETKSKWDNFKKKKINLDETEITTMISKRNKARNNKDFKLADKIRDELYQKGILIEDKDDKTTWKYK